MDPFLILTFLLSKQSTPSTPSVSVSWIPLLRQWGVTGSLLLTVVLKGLLHSHSLSVHFMVHITCSPFVRWLLALPLISLTHSLSNHNKSDTRCFQRMATGCCFFFRYKGVHGFTNISAVFSPQNLAGNTLLKHPTDNHCFEIYILYFILYLSHCSSGFYFMLGMWKES